MFLRYAALIAVVAMTSACVEERVVHDRPVVVERPVVQREYVEIVAPQPPPERIVEVEPAFRPGFIWSRGYWHWDGGRYVPVHGHWEQARPGYRFVHPHWERHSDGWHWREGAWIH